MADSASLASAAEHIKKGGIIAYPTEGVWGLGCDPYNQEAVNQLLKMKDRPEEKGLILVAASLQQLMPLLETLSSNSRSLLEASCPGPDTWLIPDTHQVIPSWIKGNFPSVAIRVSQHPIVKSLCEKSGLLVSTSANPAGRDPARSQKQVEEYFKGENIFIVPGKLGGQTKPSLIRDLLSQQIIRE